MGRARVCLVLCCNAVLDIVMTAGRCHHTVADVAKLSGGEVTCADPGSWGRCTLLRSTKYRLAQLHLLSVVYRERFMRGNSLPTVSPQVLASDP